MKKAIATFNTGSSSLKFALYDIDGAKPGRCLLRCNLQGLKTDLDVQLAKPDPEAEQAIAARLRGLERKPNRLLPILLDYLIEANPDKDIVAAGHRIVHGGTRAGPAPSSRSVISGLKKLSVFAPDHQPHNLAGVEALSKTHPDLFQSLSFDTAFHRTIPAVSQIYAIPQDLTESGLIRYGFHGLSYAHIARQAPLLLKDKPHSKQVAAHLGSGASLCAIKDGKSVVTSMGLTALSGIPMATRCGDIDPGLILHLIKQRGLSPDEVSDLLHHQSGLLGLSGGVSSDTRQLLGNESPAARQAIDYFTDRISREIGSLMIALDGLDAIIFTGGIGENSPEIRRRICQRFRSFGLTLDQSANQSGEHLISAPGSAIAAAVIPANEEHVIAVETITTWHASLSD